MMHARLFNAAWAEGRDRHCRLVKTNRSLTLNPPPRNSAKATFTQGSVTTARGGLSKPASSTMAPERRLLPSRKFPDLFPAGRARKAESQEGPEGAELIVQVDKGTRRNRAALTTYVSLTGRYRPMPDNPRAGSPVMNGDERARNFAGSHGSVTRVPRDEPHRPHPPPARQAKGIAMGPQLPASVVDSHRRRCQQQSERLPHLQGNLVIRAIHDYFQPDIGEILIDTDEVFRADTGLLGTVMPGSVGQVKRYRDDVPLFSRSNIRSKPPLPPFSPPGGSPWMSIPRPVPQAEYRNGPQTNSTTLASFCLRAIWVAVVIDFIDAENQRNQRGSKIACATLQFDHARVDKADQPLRPRRSSPVSGSGPGGTSYIPCPRCTGPGHIRSPSPLRCCPCASSRRKP